MSPLSDSNTTDTNDNSVVVICDKDDPNRRVSINGVGELKTAEVFKLVGDAQTGSSLDTQFWSTTIANGGTVTVGSGLARIRTNTTANGSAMMLSVRRSRFLVGTVNAYYAGIILGDTGVANNVRRWGAYDASDGAFFQLNGTTFGVGARNGGADTIVTSFNGSTPVVDTNPHVYEIQYSIGTVRFYQDRALIHTMSATGAAALFSTPHLKIGAQSTNSGGGTTDASLYIRGSAILRYGRAESEKRFINITTATTTVLKRSPGHLEYLCANSSAAIGATATIYNNTAASGEKIATVVLDNKDGHGVIPFNCSFDTGLTIVTAGVGVDITVSYD